MQGLTRHPIVLLTLASMLLLVPLSAAAVGSNEWEDFGANPVIDPDTDAYYPDVVFSATRFDGHGYDVPYKMYYDDGADTWLAYSEDGEVWERVGDAPVLPGLRHPQVLYDPSHFGDDAGDLIQADFPETYAVTPYYKMWLWDMTPPSSVKFAYSDDGETWHTDYPRDVCPRDEPGWLNPGSPIYDLEVLYDGAEYRGWADNNGRMYNVASSDGTTWTLDPVTPIAVDLGSSGEWDSASLSRMSVVRVSDTEWHAWYGGSTGGGGNKGIGHATSTDGVTWVKDAANPLVSLGGYGVFGGLGAPETWNNNRNYALSVLYDQGRFDVRRGDAASLKMWRSGESTVTGEKTIGFAQEDVTWRFHALAGADRYETAVEVSRDVFFRGARTVVIATGLNWPDALGGTALAGIYEAPVLLVRTDAVPEVVADEIERLGAAEAFVLGGTQAVTDKVAEALRDDLGLAVTRIGGATRYETAQLIADEVISRLEEGSGYDGFAFVATGGAFPDALSASPIAASHGWPIFLAQPGGASIAEAMAARGVTEVMILGGPVAVSETHQRWLEDEFGDANVDRLEGADRYATSVAVGTWGLDELGREWNWLGLATGEAFPDALAGSTAPARENSVMLLTRTSALPAVTSDAISGNAQSVRHVFIMGGPMAITEDVRDSVAALLP